MNRIFILVLFAFACSGCGNVTQADMRANHALHTQFDTDDSMQTVIGNIRNKAKECGWNPHDRVTLLEELGEAQIEYRSTAGADVIFWLIDLHRQDGKTRVDIYATYKMHEKVLRMLEHAAKNIPGCP